MVFEELLKEISMDDLQEQHRSLAEKIGIETLIILSQAVGGTQQYIPMAFELTKELVYKKIRDEYTGDNIQELAIKYLISESTVRRVLQDRIEKKKKEPYEGQITLFSSD